MAPPLQTQLKTWGPHIFAVKSSSLHCFILSASMLLSAWTSLQQPVLLHQQLIIAAHADVLAPSFMMRSATSWVFFSPAFHRPGYPSSNKPSFTRDFPPVPLLLINHQQPSTASCFPLCICLFVVTIFMYLLQFRLLAFSLLYFATYIFHYVIHFYLM